MWGDGGLANTRIYGTKPVVKAYSGYQGVNYTQTREEIPLVVKASSTFWGFRIRINRAGSLH